MAQKSAEDVRRENLALLNNARNKLSAAQRSYNTAASQLRAFSEQLPGVQKAYEQAEAAYRSTKAKETQILNALKQEMENDPRPIGVRKWLNEAQATERELRDKLLPKIKESEVYVQRQKDMESLEKRLVELREQSPVDIDKVAKTAEDLMNAKREFDTLERDELRKNFAYREASDDLEKANTEWAELEGEITSTIEDDPNRRAASEAAGKARAEYGSRRRAYEDVRRGLQSAKSRVSVAQRAISNAQRDIRTYEARLGLNKKKTR